jgi:hypothetical protein
VTNIDPPQGDMALRWYQTKLGFWQAIWGTLITGGLAVAIPAGVETYKIYQEQKLKQYEISVKDRELSLKDKELQGKIQDTDQLYISKFLDTALTPDIEARIRFSMYFSYVSGERYREGWEKFRKALVDRREQLKSEINSKSEQFDKLKTKASECPRNLPSEGASKPCDSSMILTVEEQAMYAKLRRELEWDFAEFGSVSTVLEIR